MVQQPCYDLLCDFDNLYAAHRAARRGKQGRRDVVGFELNLGANLVALRDELCARTYRPRPYSHFTIFEPKERSVFAPAYRDRVVQHCLCDGIVAPVLEPRLIYDNAACRVGKGTHFALARLRRFLDQHRRAHGTTGWVLKCDIKKYFDNIDHARLERLLVRPFGGDPDTLRLLRLIVSTYESGPGRGLPLGNQTSQWFALYYLDSLDRLVKEKLRIGAYSRYMDDLVCVHESKTHLRDSLAAMTEHVESLGLTFNAKTQIFPLSAGVPYLGWHTYLTDSGKIVQKVLPGKKASARRRLVGVVRRFESGELSADDVVRRVSAYAAHLDHGDTYALRRSLFTGLVASRAGQGCGPIVFASPDETSRTDGP
ncbi:MAG: RNA-directed DNA polymerase [Micrococcales bacterium]|nr:RNA-directed DNA polymerase [Micrococcales bacterium]